MFILETAHQPSTHPGNFAGVERESLVLGLQVPMDRLSQPKKSCKSSWSTDESLHSPADSEWHVRALSKGLIHHVLDDVVSSRRLHTASMSGHQSMADREPLVDFLKSHLDRSRKKGE